MNASKRVPVLLAFLAVAVIWGSTYLAIRITLDGFPPFMIGAIRFTTCGGALYGVLRARGARPPTVVEWRSAAVTGVLFFAISNGLVNVAERSVSSGLASVLVATMPLWATLFERCAGGRVARLEWVGIALGLAGVALLNLNGELRASGGGAVCALVSPMAWALGSVVSKRLPLPAGPMTTATQMIAGGVGTAILSVATGERMTAPPPARAVIAVIYLGVFGSLVAFSAYVYLLRNTTTTVATSYAYVNPIIALALGVAFAGEHIDRAGAVGALVILGGVLLLSRAKARAAERPSIPTLDDVARESAR